MKIKFLKIHEEAYSRCAHACSKDLVLSFKAGESMEIWGTQCTCTGAWKLGALSPPLTLSTSSIRWFSGYIQESILKAGRLRPRYKKAEWKISILSSWWFGGSCRNRRENNDFVVRNFMYNQISFINCFWEMGHNLGAPKKKLPQRDSEKKSDRIFLLIHTTQLSWDWDITHLAAKKEQLQPTTQQIGRSLLKFKWTQECTGWDDHAAPLANAQHRHLHTAVLFRQSSRRGELEFTAYNYVIRKSSIPAWT